MAPHPIEARFVIQYSRRPSEPQSRLKTAFFDLIERSKQANLTVAIEIVDREWRETHSPDRSSISLIISPADGNDLSAIAWQHIASLWPEGGRLLTVEIVAGKSESVLRLRERGTIFQKLVSCFNDANSRREWVTTQGISGPTIWNWAKTRWLLQCDSAEGQAFISFLRNPPEQYVVTPEIQTLLAQL